jgi:hypothetical protein
VLAVLEFQVGRGYERVGSGARRSRGPRGNPGQVAARLGLSTPQVQAVLDHAERLGVVGVAGRGCGTECPTGQ